MREIPGKGTFRIPALGLGTWMTGGRTEPDPSADPEALSAVIRQAAEAGFHHIDTAEYYAGGFGEELVGRAVRGMDRGKLFLCSKVWKTHLKYDDVLRAAEGSLRRMKTDYLDLYLIHQPSDEVPLDETVRAMNRLEEEGLVRHVGVSNFALPRLKKAMALSSTPICVNQVHCSLRIRESMGEMLSFCRENGIVLEAWRPLRGVKSYPLMEELAEKYHTSAAGIALAWLLNQPGVAVLTAMRSPGHIPENLKAMEIRLTEEEMRLLTETYPEQLAVSDAVRLQ